MSPAPDDISPTVRSVASRRGAIALSAILACLVVGGMASYVYNDVRQDLEQKQAGAAATGGDPSRGQIYIVQFGCAGCHIVPGVATATGQVGPDLGGLARRLYVGGVIANTPDNLVRFIVEPKSIDDKSAMPKTGISSQQARDVAAYLYALRQ